MTIKYTWYLLHSTKIIAGISIVMNGYFRDTLKAARHWLPLVTEAYSLPPCIPWKVQLLEKLN